LRARIYNPTNGRFETFDPFRGTTFYPITLHRYIYAENNPVNKSDPTGMWTLVEILVVLAIIGVAAALIYGATLKYRQYRRWAKQRASVSAPAALAATGKSGARQKGPVSHAEDRMPMWSQSHSGESVQRFLYARSFSGSCLKWKIFPAVIQDLIKASADEERSGGRGGQKIKPRACPVVTESLYNAKRTKRGIYLGRDCH
jgi:prepilin-type N-terminal cleavage/methylation domain-containing protein